MGKFDDFPRKMFHPDLPPFKNRVIGYIICVPLSFVIAKFYYELPTALCIVITLAFAIALSAATFFEIKSTRKDKEFINAVNNGEFHNDEKWQHKYAEYIKKHDFQQVKSNSMKVDLFRRYTSVSGVIMLIAALLFFIAAIFIRTGLLETNVILAVSGLLFGAWGVWKLMKTPVRNFIKQYNEKLPEIERSYLNGRMLTLRRNGEHSCNNGINIGSNYVVIYDNKAINCFDRSDIIAVNKHITKTKYYGNSIYTGSLFTYKIYFSVKNETTISHSRQYSLELNEFQTEMVYEALSVSGSAASAEITEHSEVGQ